MPTYDYVCEACGHELEIFQSMSEKPKRKCPACSAMKLYRKIGSGAGVIFKGSGFYQTDYRSASYKKGAEADKPAESKTDSKPTKSTDAKASGGKASKSDKTGKSD